MYLKRQIETQIIEFTKSFSAVGLRGPRQSGKSTLLKHLLSENYQYVTFDRDTTRQLFEDDPQKFMQQYSDKVIFDEVQRMPTLFEYVKIAIDNDRTNKGKFILTGSGQFTLQKNIAESLAGRIGLLTLLPFTHNEIPPQQRETSIFKGGYPELIVNDYKVYDAWFESYISTYLEKDIRQIYNIGDLRDFRRFITLLAANTAQPLNYSYYARDIGVSVTTIKRWVSILELSYIIFTLPPYYQNLGKRIVKSPRVYFCDTGFVSYLTGIETETQFKNGPMAGSIFENYIIAEILKKHFNNSKKPDIYYYRTADDLEIDLIVDKKQYRELYEIKLNSTFRGKMTRHLNKFKKDDDKLFLIYTGESMQYDDIAILNYQDFLNDTAT